MADPVADFISALSLCLSLALAFLYIADRKHKKYAFANEYSKQIMDWYSEVIEVLINLRLKSELKKSDLTQELVKLSALIERGRFFFPNIDKGDRFGVEKPIAYRGYRNLALDFLVASYKLFSGSNPKQHLVQAERLSRYFTSIVFEIIRPEENLERIREITDRYFAKEAMFEDFMSKDHSKALDFIWRK